MKTWEENWLENSTAAKHKDLTPEEGRGLLCRAEVAIAELPNAMFDDCFPLKHSFADDIYIREIYIPKGHIIATKLFRQAHATFLTEGECSIMTETGTMRINAPFQMITPAGTKRVMYTHTDIKWTTVHGNPTNTQDLKEIEKFVISPSYEELEIEVKDPHLEQFIEEIKKERELC